MKNMFAVVFILGILGFGSIGETEQPVSNGVEEEVEKFLESYRQAMDTRDLAQIPNFYVSDGRFQWIEDGEVRYRSTDAVIAALTAFPIDAVIRTEYDRTEIIPVGANAASVSMGFRTVIGEGPSSFEYGGMISLVLEKGPMGWQIVGGHTSTSRPERR